MALFDCFLDDYHQVRFDNLYMSAKFCLGAATHPKKVMVEGVTRTSQRGLPKEVIQHEVKNKKEILRVKGTVKAAVLENCEPLKDSPLVAVSVYDQKGVHFLSTCATKIEWIEKERQTWDRETSCLRLGRFLRLCINDDYNNKMNNVDIADQLRAYYRPDRWMRKQKWWWAMFFWGHGTLLVNVFVSYKRFLCRRGKRKPLSHYNFRKSIVLAKICPEKYGAPKQQASIAVQRGEYRATNRLGKRKSTSSVTSRRVDDDVTIISRTAKKAKTATTKCNYFSIAKIEDKDSDLNRTRLSTGLRHLPVPALRTSTNGFSCQLCRWATGSKFSSQLAKCNDCGIHLCLWCYHPFHTAAIFDKAFQDRTCKEIGSRKHKPAAAKKAMPKEKAARSKRKG